MANGDDNIQDNLKRAGARVNIKTGLYDDGAEKRKELPLVMGVLAQLSGNQTEGSPNLNERKFVEVNKRNFDAVLAGMKPRLTLQVDNKLTNDGTQFAVNLAFGNFKDFEPGKVVEQIEPLRRLLELRTRLKGLKTQISGNDELRSKLLELAKDTEQLKG